MQLKKTLVALAAIAAAGTVSAQSSVTVYGVIDLTVAHGSGSIASINQMNSGGNLPSRLGFRGQEDLGDGTGAGFWLESGINTDSGSGLVTNSNNQTTGNAGAGGLTFNRRSTISIGGRWGELRLGRDYAAHFWNQSVYDPFYATGVGTTVTYTANAGDPIAARVSNSISYLYGHPFNAFASAGGGGFHALLQYYLGENASNAAKKDDGNGYGLRLGYNAGPFTVAGSYGKASFVAGDIRQSSLAGSYDFRVAKVMAQLTDYKKGTVPGKGGLLGALIPAGPGTIRTSYSTYKSDAAGIPRFKKLAVGYVYDLSKRTALTATYARLRNSGGGAMALNGALTAPNTTSSGFDLGIRTTF